MCFCNKTVVCNFCSGDDNVHDLICTKTISYCKSDTRRHKHQDLVEKHWLTIGRLWKCRTRHRTLRNWHIVDKGKQINSGLHFHLEFSDQQEFKTPSTLKALYLLKQNGFKFESK